ncbi:MAG: hypothetical protein WDN30_13050 [Pararobbsia sp.]
MRVSATRPALGCPATALATDVGREDEGKPVRGVYTRGIQALIGVIASFSKSRATRASRQRALARMSTLVGALTLARAVRGDPLSDEILAAARDALRTDRATR